MKNTFLDEAKTAKRHSTTILHLKSLREKGQGPSFLKLKNLFLYPIEETDNYFSKGDKKWTMNLLI